jgi:outer membrane immunogenic protein
MKKVLISFVAIAALTLPAAAADLAARPYSKAPAMAMSPMYDWSGFYVGGNGGYGSGHNCWEALNDSVPAGATAPGNGGCHDATGGFVGGQAGYRWQTGPLVFGLEAQGDWANFRGSNLDATFGTAAFGGVVNRSKIDAFGLFTGQVGYSWNNVLLYVKGGAAVTSDTYDKVTTLPATLFTANASETRWGGTVGTGLEYGFASNWSVGVEYDHLFMGTHDVRTSFFSAGGFGPAGTLIATASTRIRQDADLIAVRLNYRFGGPVIAKY